MKLLRYGPAGSEKPGLLDRRGKVRDLSATLDDITPETLAPKTLAELRGIDPDVLPLVDKPGRMGCPLAGIGKIVGVGLNYADHAIEAGLELPAEPVLFMKSTSALCGPDDGIIIPRGSLKTDWEVELGIIIGRRARYVGEDDAPAHIAGFVVVNDVSERSYQFERAGQWDKGKGCDSFCPVGPWLVTADEIADPHNLSLWLELNGQMMQDSNTAEMVVGIPKLVSYISEFMTLEPGDLICTGTPAGVGLGQKPEPIFLRPGDTLRLTVEGIGMQTQVCRAWSQQT